MSCGVVFALNRLKRQDIFCISPPRINMAGQISTFVFDKTGTLTEEGLSVLGFRPTEVVQADNQKTVFMALTRDAGALMPQKDWQTKGNATAVRNLNTTLLAEAMASCTAVTYVNG